MLVTWGWEVNAPQFCWMLFSKLSSLTPVFCQPDCKTGKCIKVIGSQEKKSRFRISSMALDESESWLVSSAINLPLAPDH